MPRVGENLTAKKDPLGKLILNPDTFKKLYTNTYINTLRHRKMNPEVNKLKHLREYLFVLRLESAKVEKTPDWNMKQLEKTLKKLKSGKSQDPNGLVNELFQEDNIGNDLKHSILIMMNKIKQQLSEPDFIKL